MKPILGDCLAQSKKARLGKSDKIIVKHIEKKPIEEHKKPRYKEI